jgi:hypothetical protein
MVVTHHEKNQEAYTDGKNIGILYNGGPKYHSIVIQQIKYKRPLNRVSKQLLISPESNASI